MDHASTTGVLVQGQLQVWPEHATFLSRSVEGRDHGVQESTERIAQLIWQMTQGDLTGYFIGYRWMCEAVTSETYYFLRTGRYRNDSFAAARAEVYERPDIMAAYMKGLLLSQVFWANHAAVMDHYLREFLGGLPEGGRHLEIGPGHGMLTALAALTLVGSDLEAWDISSTSLAVTANHLALLGLENRVTLRLRDACAFEAGDSARFTSLVVSEVLEHVEDPTALLRSFSDWLGPGGKVFINVPVNSPAPDHIYLLRSPEEAEALVESAGLRVESRRFAPVTGYTEVQARKHQYSINCSFIARKEQ